MMSTVRLESIRRGYAFNRASRSGIAARPAVRPALGAALVGGCVLAAAAAGWWGEPAAYLQADVPLARLLRGMALIKAGVVLAAVGALWWRFSWPVSKPAAATYLLGSWTMAAATMLVWRLTLIPAAGIAFHAAALAILIAVWQEHRAENPPGGE